MPELPEVEVIRRGLAPVLCDRRLTSVVCHRRALRHPVPDLDALHDCICTNVARRGKYLLFYFSDKLLAWHLGMSGQLLIQPQAAPAGAHEHLRLDFAGGISLRYRDARRFGYVGLMDAMQWQRHSWFNHLGPEPLASAFNGAYLAARCRGRRTAIKQVLMDGRVVVGIGNIYANEALHLAGIHPARAAGRIGQERLAQLAIAVKQVLTRAIAAGGSSIRDFIDVAGKPGYFAYDFHVYGREGLPCPRCHRRIRRRLIAGRSSFYCPGCQH